MPREGEGLVAVLILMTALDSHATVISTCRNILSSCRCRPQSSPWEQGGCGHSEGPSAGPGVGADVHAGNARALPSRGQRQRGQILECLRPMCQI